MRVIGSIPHPRYKITVFKTDTRFPLQFEDRELVQIYRLRRSDTYQNLADVKAWVTTARLDKISQVFDQMRRQILAHDDATDPRQSKSGENDLPVII